MFITPYFGGCKYTNYFLFINKKPVFQCFELLITYPPRHPPGCDMPSKLRPFLLVFGNSGSVFPENHRFSGTVATFFPQKPSQLCINQISFCIFGSCRIRYHETPCRILTDRIMETDRKWIVVRIDGKIAAVSTDYRALARIAGYLASSGSNGKTGRKTGTTASKPGGYSAPAYGNISATATSLEDILKMKQDVKWDDFILFGTEFQKKVWKRLFEMTHAAEEHAKANGDTSGKSRLISYSDFAELCDNRAGVRAVAHAIGLNPISILIPCHLVVPKESIDKIREIRRKAESTIFKGEDLCLDSILSDAAIDFGEYAQGKELKRMLIMNDLKQEGADR